MQATYSIGLGDCRIAPLPKNEEKWVIYGLGSCIGLILCDRLTKISAMAHIVLPEPNGSPDTSQPAKYVATAVPHLLEKMVELGASRIHIYAQIAGGACMLSLNVADIGAKNIQSVQSVLSKNKVPLVAKSVGGNRGRTLHWHLQSGQAVVSRIGFPDIMLTPEEYQYRGATIL